MSGDPRIAPVIQHTQFVRAGIGGGIGRGIAGDGGIGGEHGGISRNEFGLRLAGPEHFQMAGGGAGAVAHLVVGEHEPGGDLAGPVNGGRHGRQGGQIARQFEGAGVVPDGFFAKLEGDHGLARVCFGPGVLAAPIIP